MNESFDLYDGLSYLSGMLAKGQVDVPIPMHIGIHESEVRIELICIGDIYMHVV